MRPHAQQGSAVVAVATTLLIVVLSASAQPVHSELLPGLEGSDDDRRSFLQKVSICVERAPKPFAVVLFDAKGLAIRVARGAASDVHMGIPRRDERPAILYLERLEMFPELVKAAGGNWTTPDGHPAWSSSLCSVLGHELAEAKYHVKHSFEESHQYGIRVENMIRLALGQSQCRHTLLEGNEIIGSPHGDHSDTIVRYGNHTLHIHTGSGRGYPFVTYEEGQDQEWLYIESDISDFDL